MTYLENLKLRHLAEATVLAAKHKQQDVDLATMTQSWKTRAANDKKAQAERIKNQGPLAKKANQAKDAADKAQLALDHKREKERWVDARKVLKHGQKIDRQVAADTRKVEIDFGRKQEAIIKKGLEQTRKGEYQAKKASDKAIDKSLKDADKATNKTLKDANKAAAKSQLAADKKAEKDKYVAEDAAAKASGKPIDKVKRAADKAAAKAKRAADKKAATDKKAADVTAAKDKIAADKAKNTTERPGQGAAQKQGVRRAHERKLISGGGARWVISQTLWINESSIM